MRSASAWGSWGTGRTLRTLGSARTSRTRRSPRALWSDWTRRSGGSSRTRGTGRSNRADVTMRTLRPWRPNARAQAIFGIIEVEVFIEPRRHFRGELPAVHAVDPRRPFVTCGTDGARWARYARRTCLTSWAFRTWWPRDTVRTLRAHRAGRAFGPL